MQDAFWAPRQRTNRKTSISWLTKAHDRAGGIDVFRVNREGYRAADTVLNKEAIKCIEAMATAVGLERDRAFEGLIDAWVERVMEAQGADGYLLEHFPPGDDRPTIRWLAAWWSHETFTTGHYIESAIAYREATGSRVMYDSALRAADNMVAALLPGARAYASGHPEIEQALMRLYGVTGERKYLQLCGWLLDQRGHHEARSSFGSMRQDDIPLKEQRVIEGHAVMAGFLWNGATQYVGATGDPAYRQAVLAVWEDFVKRKMFIHGGGGNQSSRIEGYRKEPFCIRQDDAYCESCSVYANFRWAHSLASLTGEACYIDVAERMLYNAFYASLSLKGDSSFYCNVLESDPWDNFGFANAFREEGSYTRSSELATSCCPPNIVKLLNTVNGFFYSTDVDGIYVNHYGACEANIPWGVGVKLIQRTRYPWDGTISVLVEPRATQIFTLRLRMPAWAQRNTLTVNRKPFEGPIERGWLTIRRRWRAGDEVTLNLPMDVRRITMPPDFKEYENRAALARGPIVYCLEEQDLEIDPQHQFDSVTAKFPLATLYIPKDAQYDVEHRPDLLGGVTVLRGEVRHLRWFDDSERSLSATFIPYGVWDNRKPGAMRIWLGARKAPLIEMILPHEALGESCVG